MAESNIEELRRENAELKDRIDRLQKLLAGVAEPATMLDVIDLATRSRTINDMSAIEMGSHLREVSLHCVRLARESADARVARKLESISIEIADRAGTLEAIFAIPHGLRKVGGTVQPKNKTHSLTPRELDALQWVARGKTAWEIAKILRITKRTVDEHVQTAVRKLDAANRCHAVTIAIRKRIIYLEIPTPKHTQSSGRSLKPSC
jgi:DNA-binding CsgD family transcriptional regulator